MCIFRSAKASFSKIKAAAIILSFSGTALALSSCSVENTLRPTVDLRSRTAAVQFPARHHSTRNAGMAQHYASPHYQTPQIVMPRDEVQCRKRLKRLGVNFTERGAINDGGGCKIDWPVVVTGLPRGVDLQPKATLTCAMAEAVANWTKKELVPSSRMRYFSGVKTIRQGSSYSCRRIAGSGRLSAHAKGNALDIMEIRLNNGKSIDVRKPNFFSFREKGLLKKVRMEACPYFNTVLGPGYNRAHKDHFHFDLMHRSSKRRVCK